MYCLFHCSSAAEQDGKDLMRFRSTEVKQFISTESALHISAILSHPMSRTSHSFDACHQDSVQAGATFWASMARRQLSRQGLLATDIMAAAWSN